MTTYSKRQALAKWLQIFPGEGKVVAYALALNFLLGIGMAIGSGSSESLFFKQFGVEYVPHTLFATALLLFFFGIIYAAVADRITHATLAIRLIALVTALLLALWLSMRAGGGRGAILGYYLCFTVTAELLISHSYQYFQGFFDATQGKRLVPLISAGQRLGGIAGGLLVGIMARHFPIENLILAWVVTLILSALLIASWHKGEPRRSAGSAMRRIGPLRSIGEGLRYARSSRFMQLTAAGVFGMMVLVSTQNYLASTVFTRHFADTRALAEFFGWYLVFVNTLTLVLQSAFTGRLLRKFGLKTMNLVFPLTSLATFGLMTLSASLGAAMLAQLNSRGLLRAFRHPVYNLYFHAIPAHLQGRASAMQVGLVVPLGMAASGLMLIWIPKEHVVDWLGLMGMGLSLAYLVIKIFKNRAYGESLGKLIRSQIFSPRLEAIENLDKLDNRTLSKVADWLRNAEDESIARGYVEILARGIPKKSGPILLSVANRFSGRFQEIILNHLVAMRPANWKTHARYCLAHGDRRLRCAALVALMPEAEAAELQWVKSQLSEDGPVRCKATALRVALLYGDVQLQAQAAQQMEKLLISADRYRVISALLALRYVADAKWIEPVRALTHHQSSWVRAHALIVLGAMAKCSPLDLAAMAEQALGDASISVRVATVMVLGAIADPVHRMSLLLRAVHDENHCVRRVAFEHAEKFESPSECLFAAMLEKYGGDFEAQLLLLKMLAGTSGPERKRSLKMVLEWNCMAAMEQQQLLIALDRAVFESGQENRMHFMFLREVLAEEVRRHLDLALRQLELLEEKLAAAGIRAAWESGNRRLRAAALESVWNWENEELVRRLLSVLEAQHNGNWQEVLPSGAHASGEDVMSKCRETGSPWLRQCATALCKFDEAQKPMNEPSYYEQILLLKKVPLFSMLRTDQLRHLVAILEPVSWIRGETVFEQGDPADSMYLIMSGKIGISLTSEEEQSTCIAELTGGDFFGEMSLLDELPRSAGSQALQDTEALSLGKERLRGLLLAYPELGIGMLKSLSRRMRKIDGELAKSFTAVP